MHAQLLRLFWKTSLLCVYSSCFANGIGSWIISARVGFTAVLPCEFNYMSIRALHVLWKIDEEIVFERSGEEAYEGEGYEHRADVPEDELRKGNCSLVLKNVSVTDAGSYSSYLVLSRTKRSASPGWSLIQTVELSVHESPTQPAATDDGGMNSSATLMMVISLLLLASHFSTIT